MPAERIPRYDGEHAVVHLSDLHFGSPNYQGGLALTKDFLREIKPDLLLVTGDLVDSPEKKRYEEAKNSLDELHIQYFVCVATTIGFTEAINFPHGPRLSSAGCLLVFTLSVGTLLYRWYTEAVGGPCQSLSALQQSLRSEVVLSPTGYCGSGPVSKLTITSPKCFSAMS